MNNLEKYVGLLNDIAPKGEFLAYINEEEAEMLNSSRLVLLAAQPYKTPTPPRLLLKSVVKQPEEYDFDYIDQVSELEDEDIVLTDSSGSDTCLGWNSANFKNQCNPVDKD